MIMVIIKRIACPLRHPKQPRSGCCHTPTRRLKPCHNAIMGHVSAPPAGSSATCYFCNTCSAARRSPPAPLVKLPSAPAPCKLQSAPDASAPAHPPGGSAFRPRAPRCAHVRKRHPGRWSAIAARSLSARFTCTRLYLVNGVNGVNAIAETQARQWFQPFTV